MVGNREQLLEAVIDPAKLETYGISNTSIIQTVSSNNRLIPAGQVDTGQGSFSIKVPGLIEDADDDIRALPVRNNAEGSITLGDVASVRRTFKDATGYSFINGKKAIAIEVRKRLKLRRWSK